MKSVAAHASVVDSPRFGVTHNLCVAEGAHVCVSFYCLPDLAFRHVKSVAAHASVVDSPRFGVTHNLCVAEGAHVNVAFCHRASVLHAKSVPAFAAMIHLTCTHRALHGFAAVRTNVFA